MPHPASMGGPCPRASADVHHRPETTQPPREVAATRHSQAGRGGEGKLTARPPSQEGPALSLSPGLGLSEPRAEPPRCWPACTHLSHGFQQGALGRTEHRGRREERGPAFLEPIVQGDNSQLPGVPRGGACASGLGDWVEGGGRATHAGTPQQPAGLGRLGKGGSLIF